MLPASHVRLPRTVGISANIGSVNVQAVPTSTCLKSPDILSCKLRARIGSGDGTVCTVRNAVVSVEREWCNKPQIYVVTHTRKNTVSLHDAALH